MKRLGWGECVVLLAFWLGGLAAYLTGGLVWLGYVLQAFMWVSLCWLVCVGYLEFRDELIEEWRKEQAFREWRKRQTRLRGME